MNQFCATPEMTDVSIALFEQAKSTVCACGSNKSHYGYAFCDVCMDRLLRIDRWLFMLIRRWYGRPDPELLWLYDLCVDLLRDSNAGNKTHKERKSKED